MNLNTSEFFKTLATQRWDDHRYYHQSRINQALHLLSAISFLCAYALLFIDPAMAAIIGWCVSMVLRQSGHFFFEPRGFDHINGVTDAHKEEIKVGYNIQRKVVLVAVWAAVPALLWWQPSLFGLVSVSPGVSGWVDAVGLAWLALGVAGLLLRVGYLWQRDGAVPALAWGFKILTDPVYDIKMYWRSPLALMRGELLDPMHHVKP